MPYPYAQPTSPYPGAPPAYPPAPGYFAPQPGAPYPVYYVPVAVAPVGPVPGKRRRPGYFIIAVGSAIALIGYFALPLLVFSLSASAATFGYGVNVSYAYTASQLTSLGSFAVVGSLGFMLSSLFWLLPLVGIVGLLTAIAVPFTNLTANRSAHWLAAIGLQLSALAAAAVLYFGTLQVRDTINQMSNLAALGGATSAFNETFDLGFGLYVILGGLALVFVGGIVVLARGDRAATVPAVTGAPPAGA